jgi:glycosyltransferase involved in cell wall biosynthesis
VELSKFSSRNLYVTVLMPAFNAERTIRESIQSLQEQTVRDWTLLVIDDGSSDHTPQIVREMAADDARITLLEQDHAGLCAALNRGLQAAQTPVIARLDSDDLWAPEHLEKQLAFWSEHPEIPVLGTWGSRINARSERVSRLIVGPSSLSEYEQQMAEGTPIFLIHSSVLAKRQVLLDNGGYQSSDYPAEDIHLWTRIAKSKPVMAIPDDLTSYRLTGGGVSAKSFKLQTLQIERLRHQLKTGKSVSVEEFRRYLQRDPVQKFRFEVSMHQRYWFRKGASYACNGRRLKGGAYVALSAAMNPALVLKRMWFGV